MPITLREQQNRLRSLILERWRCGRLLLNKCMSKPSVQCSEIAIELNVHESGAQRSFLSPASIGPDTSLQSYQH
eukprot:3205-Heterococcus_DN1.PRE.4